MVDTNDAVISAINDSNRALNADVNSVKKDLHQSALGVRDSVERGILNNLNATYDTSKSFNAEINSVKKDVHQSALGLRDSVERGILNNLNATYDTSKSFNAEINSVKKDVHQSSLGLRDSVERGILNNLNATYESSKGLTADITGISKDVYQSTLGLRDAVERGILNNSNAIERTSNLGQMATERVGSSVTASVERNGANSSVTLERIGGNVLTAIERVAGENRVVAATIDAASRQAAADYARDISVSVERNGAASVNASQSVGANLLGTIERNAGEGRMVSATLDAASRQAAANAARDIAVSIERNGANAVSASQSIGSTLLSSVERNAGESRAMALQSAAVSDSKLTDVRYSILNEVAKGHEALMTGSTQNLNVITKNISDSAWETRNAMNSNMIEQLKIGAQMQQQSAAQYSSILLENQKSDAMLSSQVSGQYSSLLLEQQKLKEYLSSKGDSQFAMNQLEMQKVKEGLASQASNYFAVNQLEQQKVKECLAAQASNHFAVNQLEQQKLGASISAQLAEAKYEALKNQQVVANKIEECCCAVKEKMDVLDRDRLRDGLTVEKNDNNMLKVLEIAGAFGGLDGDRYRSGRRHRH